MAQRPCALKRILDQKCAKPLTLSGRVYRDWAQQKCLMITYHNGPVADRAANYVQVIHVHKRQGPDRSHILAQAIG